MSQPNIDPYVMYLIVRESLGMGIGKTGVQTGHAVDMIIFAYMQIRENNREKEFVSSQTLNQIESMEMWRNNNRTKLVKRADDKEFAKVKEMFGEFVVIDAGYTEVPAGSETVIGIWPMLKSNTPKLIKRLRLL